MALLPYIVAYVAIAIFIIAVIARFIMWSRMPMHLRWELYPVAHEASRAHYGGSYLEESDWWTKKREVSLWGELKVMVPEIVFLVALKEHNPKLWTRSFPFHFGLYNLAVCVAFMAVGGILGTVAPSVMGGALGTLFRYAIPLFGYLGLGLGLLGAIGLLQRRLTTPEMRSFATSADFLNLIIFIVVFSCTLVTVLMVDRGFTTIGDFTKGLVTFNMTALQGEGLAVLLPTISIVLLALMLAYIPLTHMSHFVGKYFAYHAIRWNDEPNLPGSKQEKVINELLMQKVSWAAPHIKGEGKKTWVDIATEEIES